MKRRLYVIKNEKEAKWHNKWYRAYRESHKIKGASVVKSFGTEREANILVKSLNKEIKLKTKDKDIPTVTLQITDEDVVAFTDGAYSDRNGLKYRVVGIGVVYFDNRGCTEVRYGLTNKPASLLKNIFAEIESVRCAISMAVKEGKKSITICHDYNGVAMWAQNKWQARCSYTRGYVKFIKEVSKDLSIRFVNIKAHNDIKYNELANLLSEIALIEETERVIRWYKKNVLKEGEEFVPNWGESTGIIKDEHMLGDLEWKLKLLREFKR